MAVSFDDVHAMWSEVLETTHKTVVEPLLAQDAAQHWASVREGFIWLVLLAPDLWLDVSWAAAVCDDRRRTFIYRSFIYAFATCLLFSDAGSVAMHLAIGEAPPIFASNIALVAPAVAWFVMFFTPLRHLYSFFPIKVLFILGQAICWQRCVCLGVGLGISRFPNSFVTPILLAIFGGSAAGVLMNLEKHFWGAGGDTSTHGVKLSFLAAVFYYSQHPAALSHGLLVPFMSLSDAKVLIAAVLVGWSIVAELWGPINPFGVVEAVFGFIFLDDEQAKVYADNVAISAAKSGQQRNGKPKAASKHRNQEKQQQPTDDEVDGAVTSPTTLRNRKKRR